MSRCFVLAPAFTVRGELTRKEATREATGLKNAGLRSDLPIGASYRSRDGAWGVKKPGGFRSSEINTSRLLQAYVRCRLVRLTVRARPPGPGRMNLSLAALSACVVRCSAPTWPWLENSSGEALRRRALAA